MKTAVIIARFQSPFLHEGHTSIINTVKEKHDKVVILLGISPVAGSRKNPFDYGTREKMIKDHYPDIVVLPLSDQADDTTWSKNLDQLLFNTFPMESFLLYGGRDSFIPSYKGVYETVELPKAGNYSATEIRNQFSGKRLNSEDFRAGIIYAYHNQYPKTYATVDIAVFRNSKTELLVARKPNENQWRLPGGFSDPADDSFEQTAMREMLEECGAIEVQQLCYEASSKIDDWRYRGEPDKIITTLFSCDYIKGTPQPQDDIKELKWCSLTEIANMIQKEQVSTAHLHLFELLIEKYIDVQLLK